MNLNLVRILFFLFYILLNIIVLKAWNQLNVSRLSLRLTSLICAFINDLGEFVSAQ